MTVSDKNIKAFIQATKALNKVIAECKKDATDCFVYLDGNNHLCLLDGSVKIGYEGVDETILACENLNSECGDW